MLKGFWKERKGNGQAFRYKFKDWLKELKFAWQRAYRGYDDCMIWSANYKITEYIINILTEWRKNANKFFETNEETDKAIDEIIYLFKHCFEEDLYDNDFYESLPVDKRGAYWNDLYNKGVENQKKAFELLDKYFDCLWY